MKILIVCFSSVSNVACIVPQLFGLVRRYPEHEFTVLSRNFLEPLFSSLPVRFEGADIRKEDYGLAGAFRIYRRLVNKGYDVVIDMQGHWRSHIITSLLKAKGSKRYVISSERGALRKLVSKGAAASNPIKTIFERQADVWKKVGLQTDDSFVMSAAGNPSAHPARSRPHRLRAPAPSLRAAAPPTAPRTPPSSSASCEAARLA